MTDTISCGIYVFRAEKLFEILKLIFKKLEDGNNSISMEQDILPLLTNKSQLYGVLSDQETVINTTL